MAAAGATVDMGELLKPNSYIYTSLFIGTQLVPGREHNVRLPLCTPSKILFFPYNYVFFLFKFLRRAN